MENRPPERQSEWKPEFEWPEPGNFRVVLVNQGDNVIGVRRTIQAVTGLEVDMVKHVVDELISGTRGRLPVFEGITKDEAYG